MSLEKPEAFVTLATTEGYAVGALVLASSLKRVKTTKRLVCMVTPPSSPGSSITARTRLALDTVFDDVIVVDVLDSNDTANLALLQRPDLGITFTKLNCWNLTQYSKCVFLDADTMVLRNCDELFEREELSAAPDPGWPDCFNSGVFVFSPSSYTYQSLLQFALANGSFDGGDQGLLNAFFSDWATLDIRRHLPFIYNVAWQTFYTYKPALRRFRSEVRICHFIGSTKPWHHRVNSTDGRVIVESGWAGDTGFLQTWWDVMREDVVPIVTSLGCQTASLTEHFMGLQLQPPSIESSAVAAVPEQQLTPEEHQARWEQGVVDYTGVDRFANIQKAIDEKLSPGQATSEGQATAAERKASPERKEVRLVTPPKGPRV